MYWDTIPTQIPCTFFYPHQIIDGYYCLPRCRCMTPSVAVIHYPGVKNTNYMTPWLCRSHLQIHFSRFLSEPSFRHIRIVTFDEWVATQMERLLTGRTVDSPW